MSTRLSPQLASAEPFAIWHVEEEEEKHYWRAMVAWSVVLPTDISLFVHTLAKSVSKQFFLQNRSNIPPPSTYTYFGLLSDRHLFNVAYVWAECSPNNSQNIFPATAAVPILCADWGKTRRTRRLYSILGKLDSHGYVLYVKPILFVSSICFRGRFACQRLSWCILQNFVQEFNLLAVNKPYLEFLWKE